MLSELLAQLTTFSLGLIEQFGYVGIAMISFLENVFTPIPSEAVIPFAGVLVAQGKMNAIWVWVSSMIGGLFGSFVFYYLGFMLGTERVYRFVDRWGKWFFIKRTDVDKSIAWFDRFGNISVFLGRLIPQVRSFISIPAGITKMSLPSFILLTTLGSGIWIGFLVWIGVFFGENFTVFEPFFDAIDIVFVITVVIVAAYFLITRYSMSRNTKSEILNPKQDPLANESDLIQETGSETLTEDL